MQGPDGPPHKPHVLASKKPPCLGRVQINSAQAMEEASHNNRLEKLLPLTARKMPVGKNSPLEGLELLTR